ncbi:hypothetical protein, partial [Christiangramia aquimixticola]|uniref:hypothetical protein n=1 Tax=Christiangramia aquimixticola TaxID=1697558 RepID=UPI003AA84C38
MKTIILYFSIFILTFSAQNIFSQEKTKAELVEIIQAKKDSIITEEKEQLRIKVEKINTQLENKEISREEADRLKKEAALLHAKNIENRVAIMENKMELDERNREYGNMVSLEVGEDGKIVQVVSAAKERKYDTRTTSDLVMAFGFNNALEEGQSLNDSDFKLGGSRFFEIGWAWKTRVFDNSNWLRFKYGFSFQFNGLKPTNNRFLVEDNGMTSLEDFEFDLDKSKFRMDNLVMPLHFEFGPSSKTETENRIRYSTEGKLKIGLGGYAGFNLG